MALGFLTESRSARARAHYNGKLTIYVISSCMMAATGGVIFGYDMGIAGGVTSMESFLKRFFPKVYGKMKRDPHSSNYCKFNGQLLTSFTSSLYLAGLVAAFFAAPVTRNFGRKASMLVAGLSFLSSAALGGAAVNLYMLIVGRVLLGVGVAFANQAVPLYLAEMAPPQYRGLINNGFQFSNTIGFIVATLINCITEKIKGDLGWRISLSLASIPASLLALAAILLPESPSSLIQRGRSEKASAVLRKIRGTEDVDEELQDLIMASEASTAVNHPFSQILRLKYRPQLVMAILIPFFQQVTGINVISFYAPVLLNTIGIGGKSASLLSALAIGVIGMAFNFLAMISADKFGRRALFMIGGVQMLVSQVVVGALLQSQLKDHGGVNKVCAYSVLLLIGMFFAGFNYSWGPLAWLVPSEIFPLEIRSAGQSITQVVSFVFTFAIPQTFLSMLCTFKAGIFYFFAGWVVVMTVFMYFLLPETANMPIEQMAQVWREHWFWEKIVGSNKEGFEAPI